KCVDGCTDPRSGGMAVRCFEGLPERRLYTSLPMYFSLVHLLYRFLCPLPPQIGLDLVVVEDAGDFALAFPLVNKQMEHDTGHGTAAGWEISRSALLQRRRGQCGEIGLGVFDALGGGLLEPRARLRRVRFAGGTFAPDQEAAAGM